uniref:Major capsid protein N-terminal domain-containing protein n=1 Tax=viral metagenome TaxID=1070528 RepID=A0A6C0J708_9ZZZZ
MTGGLLQLVAYGAQDIYLTGNPLITYFKTIYRRHTNFAIQSTEQSFQSAPGFGKSVTSIISKDGDLIAGAYIQTTLPDLPTSSTDNTDYYVRWTDDVGHHLIHYIDLEMSGQRIDRQYGDWMEIWAQLTLTVGQQKGYREMIGQDPYGPLGLNSGLQRDRDLSENPITGRTIYIPLQFWFCRNIGLALPLIALQYCEVKITIKFRTAEELISSFDVNYDSLNNTGYLASTFDDLDDLTGTSLWIDYILLDTEERRRFAQISHEYLIEQVQCSNTTLIAGDSVNTRTVSIDLPFEHPVKELVWVCQYSSAVSGGHVQWSNYTDRSALNYRHLTTNILDLDNLGKISYDIDTVTAYTTSTSSRNLQAATSNSYTKPTRSENPCISATLIFNGNQRFSTQSGTYFNKYVPVARHTSAPRSPGINVYSFSINPEEHQPSGTCNFSRLHDAKLNITVSTGINHNITAANNVVASNFRGSSTHIRVYATNYNILRIMSGLGGLAYRT